MKDIMFVIMLAALANFLAGSIMGPSSDLEQARGFIGYSGMSKNKNTNCNKSKCIGIQKNQSTFS